MVRIVDIRESTISLASGMRNAGIGFDEMTASVVVVVSDQTRGGRPIYGCGFDSIGRYGHGGLLRERFIPRVLAADPEAYGDGTGSGLAPEKVWAIAMRNEKAGGHGERAGAVGLLDAAIWDLQAKLEDKPLWGLLSERFPGASTPDRVAVYASGGHYRPGEDIAGLIAELEHYRSLGYRRFKIKAGGVGLEEDRRRVEAALACLPPQGSLSIDVNGGLAAPDAHAWLAAFADYGLAWIEEPVDPLDYALLKSLGQSCACPLSTGENLFSLADTRNLLEYGGLRAGLDFLNVDISLSYGLVEYLRILDMLPSYGWNRSACIPHAGHLFALHTCAGLGLGGHETAPNHPLMGSFPDGFALEDGHIRLGGAAGVGVERMPGLAKVFDEMLRDIRN